MKQIKTTTLLRYTAVILLLGVLIALQVFKKEQSPPIQEETQNALVKPDAQQVIAGDKIPLKILYVGLVNTERQKDFVSFFSDNFQEVKTADLYSFKEEQTNNSDVIILDKDGIQWANRDGGKPLMDYPVSDQYSRPTISLGIPGAFWTDRMRLKTGYM
jgi:hypothetical protein